MNSIYKHADPNIAKVLVGNKMDMEADRIVSTAEAKKIATEHHLEYFETSAKDNINIQEVMEYIMNQVFEGLENKISSEGEMELEGKKSIVLKKADAGRTSLQGGGSGSDCRCTH